MSVWIGSEPFDPGQRYAAFIESSHGVGAAICFTGIVRSAGDTPLTALELECYPELAINALTAIREAALARFGLAQASILHRYGRLVPGEMIMQVMALAAHRAEAFEGASFLMDFLKTDAPFWKKEIFQGHERWVEPRKADIKARRGWDADQ